MKEDLIDEDIEINIDNISSLYELAKTVNNGINKENLDKMYGEMATLGILDNTVEKINAMFFENLGKSHPFIIDRSTIFFNEQYQNINKEEELYPNVLMLANRFAKIAKLLSEKITVKKQGEFDIEMNNLFNDLYEKLPNFKSLNFLEDIQFDSNKNLDLSKMEKHKVDEYRKFKSFINLTIKRDYLGVIKFEDSKFVDFQNFCKLKYAEALFYKVKNECLYNCIDLQNQNKDIRVYDVSDEDYNSKKRGYNLIRIDLPGYNAPFLQHIDVNKLQKIYGYDILQNLEKMSENNVRSYLNYRLNEKQKEYIEKNVPSYYSYNIDDFTKMLLYMKESVEWDKSLKGELKRVNSNSIIMNESKVKMKSRGRKSFIRDDEEFGIYLVSKLEQMIDFKLPEEYKNKLIDNKKKGVIKLQSTFDKVKETVKEIHGDKDESYIEEETVKLYTYMRINNRAFWTGLLKNKEERKKIFGEVYDNECEDGFRCIVEYMKAGKSISDLKADKKNIKNKVTVKEGKFVKYNKSENIVEDENAIENEQVLESENLNKVVDDQLEEKDDIVKDKIEVEDLVEDNKGELSFENNEEIDINQLNQFSENNIVENNETNEMLKEINLKQQELIKIQEENLQLVQQVLANKKRISQLNKELNNYFDKLRLDEEE